MKGCIGDFIIQGVKGEFYPCQKDIFEELYDYDIVQPALNGESLIARLSKVLRVKLDSINNWSMAGFLACALKSAHKRNRTSNLLLKRQLLYQLSYIG